MANILIAEDDRNLSEQLGDWLRFEKHHVDVANDGWQAADLLQAHSYDCLILDWDMPGITGPEICAQFRASGGTASVLMLTGKKELTHKEQGFAAGVDDYLTKPFHLRELSLRIQALLRRAQAQKPVIVAKADADDLIGKVLCEKYEILGVIGSGTMGMVYKAKHRLLNRAVAIKTLNPKLVTDGESVARFSREAQAVSILDHPHIVKVYDFGVSVEGVAFLVMDFVVGESLSAILAREGRINPYRAARVFIQISDALAHAHRRGIVHRDIKPGNIMVTRNDDGFEIAKLVDFGIAKLYLDPDLESQRLTKAGEVFGSPLYMSPEQCMGKQLDPRSDVFSIGCVIYETITGRPPFVGENALETMYMRMTERPKPMTTVAPDLILPDSLEQIVAKALEKEIGLRYQSMEDLKRALELMR